MPDNFPGPYEVEIFYTSEGRQHIQRLNCDTVSAPSVGDAPNTINLDTRDVVGVQLDTAVAAWALLIAGTFHTSASIDSFNFWQYAPLTTNRTFITSGLLGQAGLSTSSNNGLHQATGTFRTIGGNIMKVVLLETIQTFQSRVPYATASNSLKAISDFVVSGSNWVLARGDTFPISPLNWVGGQNEALFKRVHR